MTELMAVGLFEENGKTVSITYCIEKNNNFSIVVNLLVNCMELVRKKYCGVLKYVFKQKICVSLDPI